MNSCIKICCLVIAIGLPAATRGVTLTWDADATNGGPDDGAGIWDTVGTNWWDGAANLAWGNGTNIASFGTASGAAGAVTLGEPVTAGGVTFATTVSGDYTIAGTNTLALIGPTTNLQPVITVASGMNPTISANITATSTNSYKKGTGTLNLSGTYIAWGREVHLDGGVVNFSGPVFNANKFLVGSANVGPATVLNWNSGAGTTSNNYLGVGDNASGTLNQNGGTLSANYSGGIFIGNNAGSGPSTGIVNLAGGTLTVQQGPVWIGAGYNGAQTGVPLIGSLNITSGTFVCSGVNTVKLSNVAGQSGTINLDGGAFNLNGAKIRGGAGSSTFNFNGGVLRLISNNADMMGVGQANVRNGGAIIDVSTNSGTLAQSLAHSTIGGDNAVDGGLVKRGTNVLTLTGTNTYNGPTLVSAGILQMGNGGSASTVGGGDVTISNGAQFVFRRGDVAVFTNKITGIGTGGVLMQAAGTVTLTGTNNSWGLTYPQSGTLEFDLGDGTFTGTAKFAMNGAATATVNWKSGTGNLVSGDYITLADAGASTSTLFMTGGTLNFLNTGNRVLVGNQGVATIIVAGGTLNIGDGGSSKVPVIIGGDIQYDQSFAQGSLIVAGAGSVVIAGGSTLTLGVNTSTRTNASGTINLDGGSLQTARDIAGSNGLSYVYFNGGVLKSGAASTSFMTGLTRAAIRNGGAIIDTTLGSIVIGQPLVHSDIGGDNAADGGLVKIGAGTLTLTATNSYTGPTTVSNGTLIVNGIASTAAVTIATGATLGGTGAIAGPVVSSGTVSPGSSAGKITFETDYTEHPGASLNIDIGGAGVEGATYDQIEIIGTASITGTLNVTLINGYTGSVGDVFTVVNAAGLIGTFATNNLPALGTGMGWNLLYDGTLVKLSVTGAPPATGYDAFALAITNTAQRGAQDDPDGDGYANLLEYVTGGNPTNADNVARMNGAQTNGVLALKFTRVTNTVDATLLVEGNFSTTNGAPWAGLATNINGSWGGATNVVETAGISPTNNVTVFDTAPAATNRFLRLRVTRP